MKILEKTFVKNCDKRGNHVFRQVRRQGDICLYSREDPKTGKIHEYEVFRVKVVKAGSPLPGGGKVEEDYEQYPGASAFGRSAWSIGGTAAEHQSILKFEALVKGSLPVVEEDVEGETVETPTPRPVAVKSKERRSLKWPTVPFTQKELAAFNGIENYKEVYTDLQRALADGSVKIHEDKRESARGKAAKQFIRTDKSQA